MTDLSGTRHPRQTHTCYLTSPDLDLVRGIVTVRRGNGVKAAWLLSGRRRPALSIATFAPHWAGGVSEGDDDEMTWVAMQFAAYEMVVNPS